MDKKSAKLFFMAILLVPLIEFVLVSPGWALEKMTLAEMNEITAQGGISLAVGGLVTTAETTGFSLKDVGTRDSSGNPMVDDGYFIANTSSLFTADTVFDIDIGSIHWDGTLVFDGTSPEIAGINIHQSFGETRLDFELNDIRVWNQGLSVPDETSMGSLLMENFSISETRVKLYTPIDTTCGIRGLAETLWSVDSVDFLNEQGELNLGIAGVMLSQTIAGDLPDDNLGTTPIDTSSWAFEEGGFRIGIPQYAADPLDVDQPLANTTLPFSIDISSAPREKSETETVTTPHLRVNAPMEGSLSD